MAADTERQVAGAELSVKSFVALAKTYYSLTKPGVLFGNVISGAAGFFLAAGYFETFSLRLFVATMLGMTLVIAAACALNNVFDRDIDAKMERTKGRAVAAGSVSPFPASLFALVLLACGFVILASLTNWLVVVIGAGGFVTYVWFYGATSKRKSVHGTLVGSISGAAPILAGYCAVSGRIDAAAILVFLALFFWQFPEFYSIAIYRKKEYKAAGIPVMTVVKGVKNTKIQIFIYTILFVVSSLLLSVFGYTGWIYFAVMLAVGVWWLVLAKDALNAKSGDAWARQMFHRSLSVLLIFSAMLAVGALLP